MDLKFRRDTALRKKYFSPASFSHPAKMDAQLLLWLVREYTKPGEVILDCMAGSGTLMLACTLGRSVILVELEEKFCKMCRDNWEKVRQMPQLGETMGDCQIIQGDARQLEGLVEKIISSPPYGNRLSDSEVDDGDPQRMSYQQALGKIDKIVASPPYANAQVPPHTQEGEELRLKIAKERGVSPDKVSYMDYTKQVDKIVTSPPYAEAHDKEPGGITKTNRKDLLPYSWLKEDNPDNISNLPYGKVENIITSPPYESSVSDDKEGPGVGGSEKNYGRWAKGTAKKHSYTQDGEPTKIENIITSPPYEGAMEANRHPPNYLHKAKRHFTQYGEDNKQIGNLKTTSYLEAMLSVYRSCWAVLKDGGLLILVLKNFIRNKQVIRLDSDTILLCEKAGFELIERHRRILPSQSFWRIIYYKKHPEVEKIEHEDVLIFRKAVQ